MSQFLPEGFGQSPPSGVADITPPDPETTAADIALMQRVLSAASRNPNLIPADFMAYMLDWIQTQRLSIPIGQVFGYAQNAPQLAFTQGTSTTSSSSYGDLADGANPQLTGLSDGNYLLIYGAVAKSSIAAGNAVLSVKINATEASDLDLTFMTGASESVLARATTATLKNGNSNSLVLRYRTGAAASTATFQYRWLVAFRISGA